jgi:hypothetical protein
MTLHLTFDPPEPALLNAFEIALDYLVVTGQARGSFETQDEIARTLVNEWRVGKRNCIWLANKAIIAFEQKAKQRS